ncbi:anthranilate synthase component I family protein [Nocardioides kribbensis]|uniref:anthranilate synthase component I family protein n=1 Tax=Nocardioides kribbensis TaxID=305517 RepID=UPI0029D40FE7|nr:anthranilate synthase component I family protein [Nocardioides kribbensis]
MSSPSGPSGSSGARAGDPAAYFADVAATHPRCFWLDGGGARAWSGRRSLVGWLEPGDVSLSYSAARREVVRHVDGRAEVVGDDVFVVLEAELAAARAAGRADQWFGYLGYASRPDLPARPSTDVPDAVLMRPSHLRLFDHPDPAAVPTAATPAAVPTASAPAPSAPPVTPVGPDPHLSADAWADRCGFRQPAGETRGGPTPAYRAAFDRVQEHLHAGDTYEVNLTHRLEAASDLDPAAAYLRLRALNPAPYAGFCQHDVDGARGWLLSSSPERYAVVRADGVIETKPIKGTTPRSPDPAEDERLRAQLATEPRFRAENLMVTDLLRNDLSMVCEPGTVEVPQLMAVESYASVHQLVTTVRGRLRQGVGTVEALRALFPAGSMTGAPKLRTMQVVEEVEATARGAYAGAFGWVAADGRADLGVVIRSLTTTGDGRYRLGTGGGVTVHSDVDSEWAETQVKAERLLRVLGQEFDGVS